MAWLAGAAAKLGTKLAATKLGSMATSAMGAMPGGAAGGAGILGLMRGGGGADGQLGAAPDAASLAAPPTPQQAFNEAGPAGAVGSGIPGVGGTGAGTGAGIGPMMPSTPAPLLQELMANPYTTAPGQAPGVDMRQAPGMGVLAPPEQIAPPEQMGAAPAGGGMAGMQPLVSMFMNRVMAGMTPEKRSVLLGFMQGRQR